MTFLQVQAQKDARTLTWSIGEVEMTRGKDVRVSYPIMVTISDAGETPQLGTSTFRFFYDAGSLSQLSVENLENGYRVKGLNQSKDVFGDVFGFVGGGGIFAQFNLIANQQDLLDLTTEPVHVMDLTFTVSPGAKVPFCAPLVLDNNPEGWEKGKANDSGFLSNDAGIVGTYFLNKNTKEIQLADDEVLNFLWEQNPGFDRLVDQLNDRAGSTVKLKSKMCIEPKNPVHTAELGPFNAQKEANAKVRLDWLTISEFNNSFFEIQRSKDGFLFETIGTVSGKWNTVEETLYDFLDETPLDGTNYYRLKQVDNNGRVAYSDVREIVFEAGTTNQNTQLKISYYPNPSKGMVRILSNTAFEGYEVSVLDAEGRFIFKRSNINTNTHLDLSELSAGVYTLSLSDKDQAVIATEQVVIVKK